jgi:hypothetical protein
MPLMETKAYLFVQSHVVRGMVVIVLLPMQVTFVLSTLITESDISVKDVCYNVSEEHRPPKSLTMTREVNLQKSSFECRFSMSYLDFWADYYLLITPTLRSFTKSVGSCGILSLLFMIKAKV